MKERILRFLLTYALLTLIFAAQHLVFIAFYHSLFAGVGLSGALAATWHGLRLDLSMAGYLTVIPGLLLAASAWTRSKALGAARAGYFAFVAAAIAVTMVVDLALYDFWGFRLDATPVFYFFTSPSDSMASVSALFVAVGVVATVAVGLGVFFLLNRLAGKSPAPIAGLRGKLKATGAMLLLTALLFLPIRGSVTTSTMNLSAAYFSQNQRLNHAAINPMFSFMYSALHQTNFDKQYRFMAPAVADSLFAALADRPAAADSVPRIFSVERPNVIVVVLESFSSHLMPSLGGDPIAVGLDSLAREGVSFTNFYGNSFRTDRGLVSILSGYPAQPNTSIMKFTEKVEGLPSIPRSLTAAGYDAAYYYGGDANFTNMQAYLVSAGFSRIVCDNDFPLAERTGKWGAPDHLVFARLLADLKGNPPRDGAPLLRVLQTSSSHEPFEVPFSKLPDKVTNAFAYTDSCLVSFIGELRRLPIWRNTAVVLVPDHQGCYPPHCDDPVERHRIPLVIVGGAVAGPMTVDAYASQIDIAATLLYQLGIPHGEFAFSKNALNPASPHFAYFTEPTLFGMITADNRLVYSLDGNTVITDDGASPGANLEPGKALLQKLYDDLARR